jgi:predicted regulator of Ras-like GTPase activity (Roadblock/LC7/MglB family)
MLMIITDSIAGVYKHRHRNSFLTPYEIFHYLFYLLFLGTVFRRLAVWKHFCIIRLILIVPRPSIEEHCTMAKSRTELMVDRLRDLQATTPEIEASAVVSVDGLAMASSLPANVEEDRVSAMSAAMLSLGERISTELGRGKLDQVYIRGNEGLVVLMSVGEEAVLTTLVREGARLGLILLDMRRTADDLGRLV